MPASTSESDLAFHFLGENYLTNLESNYDLVKKFIESFKNAVVNNKAADSASIERETAAVSGVMKDKRSIPSDVGEDFEALEVDFSVTDDDIVALLKRAAENHYEACLEKTVDQNIYLKCAGLLKSDYICKDFNNSGGAISWNYPKNILIPTAVKLNSPNTSNEDAKVEGSEMTKFVENYQEYITYSERASIARCRSRFPVPVILYKNKFICRSGTLAVRKGAIFESIVKSSKPEGVQLDQSYLSSCFAYAADIYKKVTDAVSVMMYGMEEMKDIDAKILKVLDVKYICDLMVEQRKLHTGMWVSSSEKINMAKYGEFRCLSIPFPGCEFFKDYSKIKSSPGYENEKLELIFDWESPEVNSDLGFTEVEALPFPELKWNSYTQWDLFTLTKNYLKLLLHFLDKGEGGILVHCISGWDRTPLFISLLRISLWADNLIHTQLDVSQMAYFTLGYDWYLFGHNLPTRLVKQEEIMHFCFKFLPEIESAEYSLIEDSSEKQRLLSNRSSSIAQLSELVLKHYDEVTFLGPDVEKIDVEKISPEESAPECDSNI